MSNESNMKSIGEIAKTVQVKVSTLRYYDEIGILKPQYIDDESRYRYYSDKQVNLLVRILELKKYGFNLDAIRGLLNETSDEIIMTAYDSKIKELNCDLQEIENAKKLLLSRIRNHDLKGRHLGTKILIIDDSTFLRGIVKEFLTNFDFEVVGEASNGFEGIEKYKELKPDIVLMDIGMPELDGICATKVIVEFDSRAKIVICSAKSEIKSVFFSISNGAIDFVPKPFQPEHIIDSIYRALNHNYDFDLEFINQVINEKSVSKFLCIDEKLSLLQVNKLLSIFNSKNRRKKSDLIDFLSQIY